MAPSFLGQTELQFLYVSIVPPSLERLGYITKTKLNQDVSPEGLRAMLEY